MRAISDELRRRLNDNTTMLPKATLTLADGTVRELTGDDIVSLSVEQSTSSSSSFDVGAAVIGKLSIELNNHDGRFSAYDFTGAIIVAYAGVQLAADRTEWIRLGTYTVDQPDSYAGTISLTALDYMQKLEKSYDEVKTAYPATLRKIVSDACAACGVTMLTGTFANDSYTVPRRPSGANMNCLNVISYAAQAAGCFAKVDDRGRLLLSWYDTSAFENAEAWLDGGTFGGIKTPYADGDAADGGNFDNYGAGAAKDGGTFDTFRELARVQTPTSLTVFTDDVVITGIRVKAQNEVKVGTDGKETNGADGETALSGKEGYVLELGSNPLVAYGQAAKVAAQVAARVVGMRFRPFSSSIVSDPSIEAGDPALVIDRDDNIYLSYVTTCKLALNQSMSVACGAKSASRNSAQGSSAATQAYVKAREEMKREQNARERALAQLGQQLRDSSGLFTTTVRQPDGSNIYYMHDKADLASSKIVWKMTAESWAVSTDGGKTYATGLTATGDAILNRIYAIGIDADHITTGRIESRDGKNYFDLDSGECRFSETTQVGSVPLGNTVIKTDVQYGLSDNASSVPSTWSSEQLWKQGKQLWMRTVFTLANGSTQVSTPRRIANDKGIGPSSVSVQYYLSTNPVGLAGGSWSDYQQAWVTGRCYWTREKITWSDGSVTYSDPTFARALTSANQSTDNLDSSLDQTGVFNRLTNNGKAQGIYMSGGNLYVNGTYIKSGTIDADLVRAGRIQDKLGWNYWDLDTGEFSLMARDGSNFFMNPDGDPETNWDDLPSSNLSNTLPATLAGYKTGVFINTENLLYPREITGMVGKTFAMSGWAYRKAGSKPSSLGITFRSAGGLIGTVKAVTAPGDSSGWNFYSGYVTIPNMAAVTRLCISIDGLDSSETGQWYWTGLRCSDVSAQKSYTDEGMEKAESNAVDAANKALATYNKSLDQQAIFNRLTNNGKAQGIYMSGGNLYVNGTYIKSGTIDASIVKIDNLMKVGDSNTSVDIQKDGIYFNVPNEPHSMFIKPSGNRNVQSFNYKENGTPIGIFEFTDGLPQLITLDGIDQQPSFTLTDPSDKSRTECTHIQVEIPYHVNSKVDPDSSNNGTFEINSYVTESELNSAVGVGSVKVRDLEANFFAKKSGNGVGLYLGLKIRVKQDMSISIYTSKLAIYAASDGKPEIGTSTGETYLTSENYGTSINGGQTYTGKINIPYIYGNTMRNYRFWFKGGVLVKHDIISPTDPDFVS